MSGIRQCGGAMVARVRADHLAKEKGPAARWGYSQGGRLACSLLVLGLPLRTHPALPEPAVQDQRRCHPDGDVKRHQADQANEVGNGGYRPE